ncbi:uncharacterized protein LOC122769683 isoform X3 [Scomber scombrus]|uniref:Uncharacterized protein LOC122769683 isoform X3 n=1 Tax=Scomber scombrus TaxID=13677 RepID=A0AAV1QEC0_SCOSC
MESGPVYDSLTNNYSRAACKSQQTHRVDVERWKSRKQRKRGVYVSRLNKPFVYKQQKKKRTLVKKPSKASEDHSPSQYINAADSTVYVVVPAHSATEQADSDNAAKRLR